MDDLKVSLPRPCGQKWSDMTPDGQHRHCAACDQTIHDLATLTIEEADALLDRPGGACVRARIAADGSVALAGGMSRKGRAMKAVVGASMALAVAACQTAGDTPLYKVRGLANAGETVQLYGDDGFHTTTQTSSRDGSFTFRKLPAGTYRLSTRDCTGNDIAIEGITVGGEADDADVGLINTLNDDCIIIGVFRRAD